MHHFYSKHIRNRAGFGFRLFYDISDHTRHELTGPNFSPIYPGVLAPGNSISATFQIPGDAVDYLLVYKGTVGSSGGAALDPVDANIAIAAKDFTTGPARCAATVTVVPQPPTEWTAGPGFITTEAFTVPSAYNTVTVSVNKGGDDSIIGTGVIVDGIGEFEIVGATGDNSGGTITLKNKGLASNAQPGTVVPTSVNIDTRLDDDQIWKAVYVPTVNRIFVTSVHDTVSVINPDKMTLESYFHISNTYDDFGTGLVYAADVDRLYFVSSKGGIYVIDPHTCRLDTVIPFGGYWVDADDGFYDPINHRVGFGYNTGSNDGRLVLIDTTDNTIAADIQLASNGRVFSPPPAEYSAVDDRIYAASRSSVAVYSASDLSLVTVLNLPSSIIWLFRYSPASGEIYGFDDIGGFYIEPLGTYADTTTGDFIAPQVGSTISISINDTSGMIVGQTVDINAVGWQITSVDSQTQFEAKNLTVTPETVFASGTSVTWGGPKCSTLPELGDVDSLHYSAANQKVVVTGPIDIKMFDPVAKKIDCTIPNFDDDLFEYGCEGPDGKQFVPFQGIWPSSGVYVLH